MSAVQGPQGLGSPPPQDPRQQLRKLSDQLEGVFLNQLFQAMRATVPQGGAIDAAPGQEMFTQLFDEKLAGEAATHMQRGLGDALYRQLARRLGTAPTASTAPTAPTAPTALSAPTTETR